MNVYMLKFYFVFYKILAIVTQNLKQTNLFIKCIHNAMHRTKETKKFELQRFDDLFLVLFLNKIKLLLITFTDHHFLFEFKLTLFFT